MDPLTALGVISNVVSLVQFGGKLIKICSEAHATASGESKTLDDINYLVTELDASLRRFSRQSRQARRVGTADSQSLLGDGDEIRLLEVGEKCAEIAQTLLNHVASSRPSDPASRRARAMSMLRYIRSRRETKEMAQRLADYQAQLDTHLLLSVRQNVVDQAAASADFARRFDDREKRIIASLQRGDRKLDDICSSFHLLQIDISRSVREEGEKTRKHISNVANRNYTQDRDRRFELLHESLKYDGWDRRFNGLDPTYGDTGRWILQEPPASEALDFENGRSNYSNEELKRTKWPSLVQWLKGQDSHQVYWIAGIPAAGKSTIMKMVVTHPETLSLLGNRSMQTDGIPVLAHHFFWSQANDALPKTITGMLRSLLFQVLRVNREDWTQCFAVTAWPEATAGAGIRKGWDTGDLMTMLEGRLSRLSKLQRSVCLVIDGLDECQDDHERLVETIRRLQQAGGSNVRLLLSSRPWPVFNNAYEFSGYATVLHLHDHTASDIGRYTFERINEVNNFRKIAEANHEGAEELITNITKKSKGVFAWVTLAVNRLRKLLIGGRTDITMLLHEADRLPVELNAMYDNVLDRVDEELRVDCSAVLLLFWLFQEAGYCHHFIYEAPRRSFELSFILLRDNADNTDNSGDDVCTGVIETSVDHFADRVLNATGGILSMKQGRRPEHLVVPSMLHLTGYQWLCQETTLRRLSGWIPGGIHAGAEAVIKSILHTIWDGTNVRFPPSLCISGLCERLDGLSPAMTTLASESLAQIDMYSARTSYSRILSTRPDHIAAVWFHFVYGMTFFAFGPEFERNLLGAENMESCFLTFTSAMIFCGRTLYLPHVIKGATREELLMATVAISANRRSGKLDDLSCLIEAGVDPSEQIPELGLSAWTAFLLRMNCSVLLRDLDPKTHDIIALFLRKGAPAIEDTCLYILTADMVASTPMASEYLIPRLLIQLKMEGYYDGPISSEYEWVRRTITNGYDAPWLVIHDSVSYSLDHGLQWLDDELLYAEFLSALPPESDDETYEVKIQRRFYKERITAAETKARDPTDS